MGHHLCFPTRQPYNLRVRAFGCSLVYSVVPGWLRMSVSVDNCKECIHSRSSGGMPPLEGARIRVLFAGYKLQVHILSGHEAG